MSIAEKASEFATVAGSISQQDIILIDTRYLNTFEENRRKMKIILLQTQTSDQTELRKSKDKDWEL